MGVTRVRYLLKLWQRSSLISSAPAPATKKEPSSWTLPKTPPPDRNESTRPPARSEE